MALTVLGLNFHSAPLTIREQVHFSAQSLKPTYAKLRAQITNSSTNSKNHKQLALSNLVILATCNRVELYTYGTATEKSFAAIMALLTSLHEISAAKLNPYLYKMHGARAVLHLFKVAAGLKSMVLGENQILGQVKTAYTIAKQAGFAKTQLARVFEHALAIGKRVRTQTRINEGGTSIGSAAIDFVKEIYGQTSVFTVTLLGSGEVGTEVLKTLARNKLQLKLFLVNRNLAKAAALGKQYHAELIPLAERYPAIVKSDVVISAVESPQYLITQTELINALNGKSKPILFIDLSVPRSIEPKLEELGDIVLYTIDNLKSVIARTSAQRQGEVERALELINDAAEDFSLWENKYVFRQFLSDFKANHDKGVATAHVSSTQVLARYVAQTSSAGKLRLPSSHIKVLEKLAAKILAAK